METGADQEGLSLCLLFFDEKSMLTGGGGINESI